ncbi:unnamed protein product [Umbelopsis ramanniana]
MFSNFSINFTPVLAVQIKATLSLVTAQIAIRLLRIINSGGSARFTLLELLAKDIFVAWILYTWVPTLLKCASCTALSPPGTFLAYLFFLNNTHYLTNLAQDFNKARFGTESRLITSIRSAKTYFLWIILVAAICSYISQVYSGMDQQYPADRIILWGIAVLSWYHPMMLVAAKYSYRNLTTIEGSEQPQSERVQSIDEFLTMFIACEMHGMVLQLFPLAILQGVNGTLRVSFVIGAVYNKMAPPDSPILQAETPERPTSEKLPSTSADGN